MPLAGRNTYADGTPMTDSDQHVYMVLTCISVICGLLLVGGVAALCLVGGALFVVGLAGFSFFGYVLARGVAAIGDSIPNRRLNKGEEE